MESSGRDLSNDMAERRPILKKKKRTTAVLISYTQIIEIPKAGVSISLCMWPVHRSVLLGDEKRSTTIAQPSIRVYIKAKVLKVS